MLERKELTEKLFVMGIDGMDPRFASYMLEKGLMPNLQTLINRGACRKDLVMLGAVPTITPPMWTTMATGAYPSTHGITCYFRHVDTGLEYIGYNLDSTKCKAEQLWNVFAEAGKKTLVFHWPGSAWPPSSHSPNLMVVDGTNPGSVNMGTAQVEPEFVVVADAKTAELAFKEKAASDSNIPCVITDLEPTESEFDFAATVSNADRVNIMLTHGDGEGGVSTQPFDVVFSPIKEASGWLSAPEGAKEMAILFSGGLIRRPVLILKNDAGVYDHIQIFKNKKATEPVMTLQKGVFTKEIIDESIKKDQKYTVNRNMRILELTEDGSHLKMWVSAAMNIENDDVWHPKSLFKEICENVGHPNPTSMLGGGDATLIRDCMGANWGVTADWHAKSVLYLMENKELDVVFSHFHNIDLTGHMIVRYMKDKGHGKLAEEEYLVLMEELYQQTDVYIGRYMHLLDEGWTILLVSDHGQACPVNEPVLLGDATGINAGIMSELGYTVLKKDSQGNDIKEIDWSQTRAIAQRGNHIYINLKDREKQGIVALEDQYELEESIMTDLYAYQDKVTGKRVVALALRNKDAILLGMGGSECGDIIYWMAEGYHLDHGDILSTVEGYAHTSVSPIFVAAGRGIKEGFFTDRVIRQVDVVPTAAILGGVRMPRECEGAPIYQILSEDY